MTVITFKQDMKGLRQEMKELKQQLKLDLKEVESKLLTKLGGMISIAVAVLMLFISLHH